MNLKIWKLYLLHVNTASPENFHPKMRRFFTKNSEGHLTLSVHGACPGDRIKGKWLIKGGRIKRSWLNKFCREEEYSNKWVIKVPAGEHVARQVADDHGYNFVGKVIKNQALVEKNLPLKKFILSLFTSSC